MKILFAFENPLPSTEADAEVFTTTAKYLAPLVEQCWFHLPASDAISAQSIVGMPVIRAWAPRTPAALRHIFCGVTLPLRRAFHGADLVYTRNLWVAAMALLFGQKVVFDHYRPWPDQIPPLQPWLHGLFCHPRFLLGICHSDYTRDKYLALGVPAAKLACIHNGYEPDRFAAPLSAAAAKQALGIPPDRKTVVYTGRINRKKGLDLVVKAARRLPHILFVLVGAYGKGPIEALARGADNIRIVPFQPPQSLSRYIFAADVLLIPPSYQPLATFGSTVLPLKLFSYLAAGRAILAGDTPDVREVLRHGENAWLCPPDNEDALADAVQTLTQDPELAACLGAAAQKDSLDFTWDARAQKIAALVAQRLDTPALARNSWNKAQYGVWLRQCHRWLSHLVRERSWVLPPETILARGEHE